MRTVEPSEVTRLAPSPTGALHLGNARTFLLTWLLARSRGWRVTLRVEDLDGPRVRRGAAVQALDDLRWLGLDWDDGPLLQSSRAAAHRAAIDRLLSTGAAYPCACTRAEVDRAASAPHADDGASVYPGTCRGRFASVDDARRATGRAPAIRFRVDDDETIGWQDAFAGPQAIAMRTLGDFVIAKADGTPSYQLAVVVDDDAAGVTQVVRGDDLLDSTPRQIALRRALTDALQGPLSPVPGGEGWGEGVETGGARNLTSVPCAVILEEPQRPEDPATTERHDARSVPDPSQAQDDIAGRSSVSERGGSLPPHPNLLPRVRGRGDQSIDPTYWHVPLVVGTDGRRLAKRHGDTRLASYRERGVPAAAVLRTLAAWCGIEDATPATARDLLGAFDVARVPRGRVVVADRDDVGRA